MYDVLPEDIVNESPVMTKLAFPVAITRERHNVKIKEHFIGTQGAKSKPLILAKQFAYHLVNQLDRLHFKSNLQVLNESFNQDQVPCSSHQSELSAEIPTVVQSVTSLTASGFNGAKLPIQCLRDSSLKGIKKVAAETSSVNVLQNYVLMAESQICNSNQFLSLSSQTETGIKTLDNSQTSTDSNFSCSEVAGQYSPEPSSEKIQVPKNQDYNHKKFSSSSHEPDNSIDLQTVASWANIDKSNYECSGQLTGSLYQYELIAEIPCNSQIITASEVNNNNIPEGVVNYLSSKSPLKQIQKEARNQSQFANFYQPERSTGISSHSLSKSSWTNIDKIYYESIVEIPPQFSSSFQPYTKLKTFNNMTCPYLEKLSSDLRQTFNNDQLPGSSHRTECSADIPVELVKEAQATNEALAENGHLNFAENEANNLDHFPSSFYQPELVIGNTSNSPSSSSCTDIAKNYDEYGLKFPGQFLSSSHPCIELKTSVGMTETSSEKFSKEIGAHSSTSKRATPSVETNFLTDTSNEDNISSDMYYKQHLSSLGTCFMASTYSMKKAAELCENTVSSLRIRKNYNAKLKRKLTTSHHLSSETGCSHVDAVSVCSHQTQFSNGLENNKCCESYSKSLPNTAALMPQYETSWGIVE